MNATVKLTENSLSDGDLLDAWTGDQHSSALAELVGRYSRMVLSVCRRRCRSEADADDAYQTTFLYLARNAGKIRNPERLPGWLHRVAQRAATATLHNKHSQVEPMVEPPAIPDDPLERLTQRHQAIALDEELADLPEDYRAAIVMHLYEGLSVQTLADRFETTTGSIRGKLQRGKKLLARRLRRRGIVPVVAFAAANVWSVGQTQAVSAADTFTLNISDVGLPDPPIDTSLLDSLLAKGVQAMPALTTTTGVIGGVALIAALMMTTGIHGQTESDKQVVSLPAADIVPNAQFQLGGGRGKGANKPFGLGSVGKARQGGPKTVWVQRAQVPEADSQIAESIRDRLNGPVTDLTLQGLLESPEFPVFADNRALAEASVDLANTAISFDGPEMPMRSALRKMLQPHGLKAVIENDGLVVTADFAELSHRGFPMSRWIDADQEKREAFEATLKQETSQSFRDTPLNEAIRKIGEDHDIPIVVDGKALEEIGLSDDEPITIDMSNVSLRSLLRMMLRELDLSYMPMDEVLWITTIEMAEQNLLNRIYWLEGTGFAPDDKDSIIELIQTTIDPHNWDAVGGHSSMLALNHQRPSIVVNTTVGVHEKIEHLLQVLREGHFGPAPVMKSIEVPAPPGTGDFGGGGGGGGGFGGGGGGGGNF